MPITYCAERQLFHLSAGSTSYILGLYEGKYPLHLYWGARLQNPDVGYLWEDFPNVSSFDILANRLPQEYPTGMMGDMRQTACRTQSAYGDTVTQFEYVSHEIEAGKPALPGLPATYVERPEEAQTLRLNLRDPVTGLCVQLLYSLFEDSGILTRSAAFRNEGHTEVRLLEAASASVDLFGTDFEMLHLWGGWAMERSPERLRVMHGVQGISSRRGASGHEHNPFLALVHPDTTEQTGEVYAMSLVYSGDFAAHCGANAYESTRMTLGMNPETFCWLLQPGEAFQTPEAVLVYVDGGLNAMSQAYHKLYRTRLCRGQWRDQPRPILVNNWEATYFNFDEDKLLAIANRAADMGIELFVLDDGWFGHRDLDNSSLGDWLVDRRKLPAGLASLGEKVHGLGLKFGLWLEPEMVSPDSDLYRAHPDWCLHVPGRSRTQARNQLVLDLSRQDVCDYILEAVSGVLSSAPIDYIKWDMNRNFSEVGSAGWAANRQREVPHRYMLGLYRVLEGIVSRFPNVLFESCSGGGGRFDPGMLYYMPQTWTSDDTDAVERLKIQYGTSMVYPASSMGAHVSVVPNHQTGRSTPMKTRGDVALSGNYGYELDLSDLSQEDYETACRHIQQVKALRTVVQQGAFTRLQSPFCGNTAAWQFLSPDGEEVVACFFHIQVHPNGPQQRLKLRDLQPGAGYQDQESGRVYEGSVLMHAGLLLLKMGEYTSQVYHFKRV